MTATSLLVMPILMSICLARGFWPLRELDILGKTSAYANGGTSRVILVGANVPIQIYLHYYPYLTLSSNAAILSLQTPYQADNFPGCVD